MSQQDLFDYVMNTPHNTNPAILKQKIKDISGVSSWNDLTDKPFGDVPTGGDTLTWDGNTEGLPVSYANGMPYLYKISDAKVSVDDFANGVTLRNNIPQEGFITADEIEIAEGVASFGALFCVLTDIPEVEGIPLHGAGWYHVNPEITDGLLVGITIPGYTGFPGVKKMDEKYLPETVATKEYVEEVILGGAW